MDVYEQQSQLIHPIQLLIHADFKTSKAEESAEDCQDSFEVNPVALRVAVSDGATQSFHSGLWSAILCKTFCGYNDILSSLNWQEWLSIAQLEWKNAIIEKASSLKREGKVSWIECENGVTQRKPAFATFLGVTFDEDYLRGIVIGDTCCLLVQVGSDEADPTGENTPKLLRVIPGVWDHIFSSSTQALSSYPSESPHSPEFVEIPLAAICDLASLRIVFLTDALADYTLRAERLHQSVIPHLLAVRSQGEFIELVSHFRDHGMSNDDSTLVVIGINRDFTESQGETEDDLHSSINLLSNLRESENSEHGQLVTSRKYDPGINQQDAISESSHIDSDSYGDTSSVPSTLDKQTNSTPPPECAALTPLEDQSIIFSDVPYNQNNPKATSDSWPEDVESVSDYGDSHILPSGPKRLELPSFRSKKKELRLIGRLRQSLRSVLTFLVDTIRSLFCP